MSTVRQLWKKYRNRLWPGWNTWSGHHHDYEKIQGEEWLDLIPPVIRKLERRLGKEAFTPGCDVYEAVERHSRAIAAWMTTVITEMDFDTAWDDHDQFRDFVSAVEYEFLREAALFQSLLAEAISYLAREKIEEVWNAIAPFGAWMDSAASAESAKKIDSYLSSLDEEVEEEDFVEWLGDYLEEEGDERVQSGRGR